MAFVHFPTLAKSTYKRVCFESDEGRELGPQPSLPPSVQVPMTRAGSTSLVVLTCPGGSVHPGSWGSHCPWIVAKPLRLPAWDSSRSWAHPLPAPPHHLPPVLTGCPNLTPTNRRILSLKSHILALPTLLRPPGF